MLTIVYLLLGLAFMGGLFYALMQITARQRRLTAELTRLERLAAEVSLNAEAILDRVDERVDRLNELMERAEARVAAAAAAPVAPALAPVAAPVAPAPVAAPAPVMAPAPMAAAPEASAFAPVAPAFAPVAAPVTPAPVAPAAPVPPPTPIQKYASMRAAAWHLADQGRTPAEIAQEMGIPRGEVLLLLNLRAKKVTA